MLNKCGNGHQIKRGAGYECGNDEEKGRNITANLTAHSASVDKFINVYLLGIALFTKADCAAIFILSTSYSILCICRILCIICVDM